MGILAIRMPEFGALLHGGASPVELDSQQVDGTITGMEWDADTGQLVARLFEGDPGLALSWGASGSRLAAVTDVG